MGAALGLSALCACARQRDSAADESPADSRAPAVRQEVLPLRRFPSGVTAFYRLNSGMRDSGIIVVRDSGAWAGVWRRLTEGHAPAPPLPAIDFGREMALVVALGQRRTGGFTIAIDTVIDKGPYLEAYVRRRAPGRACSVTGAFTAPADVVVLGRRDGEVRIVATDTVVACGSR